MIHIYSLSLVLNGDIAGLNNRFVFDVYYDHYNRKGRSHVRSTNIWMSMMS